LKEVFHPGKKLIDVFPGCFSFYKADCHSNKNKSHHCKILNDVTLKASSKPLTVIFVSDASIKNNVAISIAYIHSYNNPIIKTIHHIINVTSTEAELFAIRCGINQAVQIPKTSCIIIITDTLYIA